jgi:GNAT superfamily N-acetyltransferase
MSADGLSFRWADRSDAQWCLRCDPSIPESCLRRKIEQGDVLLALLDEQPAGYLRLEYLWQKLPFVGLIEIPATRRRQGIGAALLTHLEDWLRARGHDRLLSSSLPANRAGQDWHRKHGFEECGRLRGVNPGDTDEVFFLKRL